MAIRFSADAPRDTHNKLGDWLPELQRVAAVAGTARGAGLNLSDGYEVKYLSAEPIAAGAGFDAAHASRWRHLVMSGSNAHGEIELDDALEPVALHEGVGKEGLLAAIEMAEQLGPDFEASVVMAPALRFIGLWLQGSGEELVVPYPPNATPLPDYRPIPVDEALAALQPLAAEVMAATKGGEPTGG